ncbi:T9SS type A sorting domain-containing protein [Marinilabiliaceae bacterium ANBcel2]|nr:T9SS type A sorting domain-containing protein [Marinilabiliaceae bacterium ANBcel2]
MFYLRSLFSFCIILFFWHGSHAQFLKSSESIYSLGHYVVTDNSNDLYIAGDFVNELSVGESIILTAALEDNGTNGEASQMPLNMFLIKSNQDGEVLWGVSSHLSDIDDVYELKGVSPFGLDGIIAVGVYEKDFNIDGLIASTTSENDMFITHISSNGVVTSLLNGFTTDDASSIIVNGVMSGDSDNVFVYGKFSGEIEVDGTTYHSDTPKLFVIDVASDMSIELKAIGENTTYEGELEGVTDIHEISSQTNITAATVTDDNSILMTVSADNFTAITTSNDTYEIGSGDAVDDGSGNIVWQGEETKNLLRVGSDGTLSILNDDLEQLPFAIKERVNGNYLLVANYVDVNPLIVIKEFDSNGVIEWEDVFPFIDDIDHIDDFSITGRSLVIDENDNFYIAGEIFDEAGFIIKFTDQNEIEYGQFIGDELNSLAVIDEYNVVGTGYFSTEVTMGTKTLENLVGTGNMFWGVIDPFPGFDAYFFMEENEVCAGTKVTMTANLGFGSDFSYQWQRNGEDIENAVDREFIATEPGMYRVLITDNDIPYTKTTKALELRVNPLPQPEIKNEDAGEICQGSTAYLSGSGYTSSTFQWYMDDSPIERKTDNSLVADKTGVYYMKETSSKGCVKNSNKVEIEVVDYPDTYDITIEGEVPFCDGSSVTLSIPDNETDVSYQWYLDNEALEGETNLELEAFLEGDYHYTVSSKKGNCLSSSNPVELLVNPSPEATISSDYGNQLCDGESLNLVANSGQGLTYHWYKDGNLLEGEDTNILTVIESGQYVVEVGFEGACSRYSEPFEVEVNPVPSASVILQGEKEICEGSGTVLKANEAPENEIYSYQWLRNNNDVEGADEILFEAKNRGDYRVVVTNEFNCQSVSGVEQIRILSTPSADLFIDGSDNTFCKGEALRLYTQSQSHYSFQWQKDGDVITDNNLASLNAVESGNYKVKVTNKANNCATFSNDVSIEAFKAPDETIVMDGENNSFCDRGHAQLSVTQNAEWSYQWIRENNYINEETTHELKIIDGGNYKVEITSGEGCKSVTKPIAVTRKSNPQPRLLDDGLFLSTQSYHQINWNLNGVPLEGEEESVFLVEESGEYSVTVIHENGCEATSEFITVCNPVPEIISEANLLKASHGDLFQWFYEGEPIHGATRQTYEAQLSGWHSVLVIDANGCQSMSKEVLTCVPAPTVTLNEEDGFLEASSGHDYQWYLDGEIIEDGDTRIYVPKRDGTYSVLVTDVNGCVSMSKSFELVYYGTNIELSRVESEIYLYPNPAESMLFVTTGDKLTQYFRLSFFNTAGKKILEKAFNHPGEEVSVDVSALPTGVYLIKYEADSTYGVINMIKK